MMENAMKGAIDDNFDEAVLSEEVQGIFEPNRKAILKVRLHPTYLHSTLDLRFCWRQIFKKWSNIDHHDLATADAQDTMILHEWIGFCNDCNLISPAFTMRECRGIFVRVNLDDDLYI
eukprot:SAG31_NODE_1972_length_6762_cov_16.244635_6_plen_118_part_00